MPRKKPVIAADPLEEFEAPKPKPKAKKRTFPARVKNKQGVEFLVSERYYNTNQKNLTFVK